jgi:hypothetical protein
VLWNAGSDVPMDATLMIQKRLSAQGGKEMAGNALRSGAWKTIAAVLLTSIPLAERMLLYHLATTALILLPVRLSPTNR